MSATPSTVCPGSNAQLVAQIGTTPSYCTATATTAGCTGDEFLSNVVFGSISNPSGCTYGAPNNSYNNFTAQSTTVVAGSVGNTLTASITNLFSGDQMRVWIDWNQDGDEDLMIQGEFLSFWAERSFLTRGYSEARLVNEGRPEVIQQRPPQ